QSVRSTRARILPCINWLHVVVLSHEAKRVDPDCQRAVRLHLPTGAGGGYTVRCAAFPEVVTNGRTLEEARTMAREALELCLEVYRDEGRPIPASDADPQKTVKEVIPVKLARA